MGAVKLTRISLNGEILEIPEDPRRADLPESVVIPMLAALCLEVGRLQKIVARLEGKPDPAGGGIIFLA